MPALKFFSISIILGFILFILSGLMIVGDGLSDQIKKSDVAIILGSKVNADGSVSARLAARLNKGIELYKKGVFPYIIVSGGVGTNGLDQATIMKAYLVAHQIPANVIIADNKGKNTQATAGNSVVLMRNYNFKNVLLISQYYHISRARLAFKHCGITPVATAHANFFELRDFYSTGREVVGFYDYLLRRNNCPAPIK